MVYGTLIFIFAITKIIISVDVLETIHETGNSTTYNCVFYGIQCHPHLSFPCCESNNKCTKIFEWSVKRHISVCLKPVLLGDSCQTDLDCLTVKNSWCNQNKKCECVNNSVQHNPSTCSSLIGGHCLTDDDCLILNTVCTDYLCTCKPSFVYRPQDQCIPNIVLVSLGSSCEHNDDCDDPGHSECSEDKICVCKPRRFIKHNTCQPRLGTFCEDSRRCTIENSLCVYNKCQCKNGYVYISYRRCEKCGFCEKHTECIIDDSICFNNKCQCKPKYKAVTDDECRISPLRKSCVDTLDCDDIWHMKCSENKTCICKANHIEVNQALCKPLLGAICHSNECGVNNSVCVDYECQCKPSFRRVSNHLCMSCKYKEEYLLH
ncbi:GSCOCG00007875001-RA-CDS [Cotesia congregata]|nr:GSCOCG00007875001-RA-CDS [Cotesia congregata]